MVYSIFSAIYMVLYFLSINGRSNCFPVMWVNFLRNTTLRTYEGSLFTVVFINTLELKVFH